MSYIALYRKWRPLSFADVVEQEHVVKTLKNSVQKGRIAHAYLFCGTRGTGKTTMAKIFSRAINCLQPVEGDPCNVCEICAGVLTGRNLDVVEIDAASNNSVDNVREIRDEVVYTPSQSKYKVYIIDEVHMLTPGAFNALLKTLEEPPSHVIFILATTEPHKLPATILSRCQRFDFRRIPIESIMQRLEKITQANQVELHKEAGKLIARLADGALRDAISILDQCMALGSSTIGYQDVLNVVGMVNDDFIATVVDQLQERNVEGILQQVDKLVMDGKDITQFVSELVIYYRNLLMCTLTGQPEEVVDVSGETIERMKKQGAGMQRAEIMDIIREFSKLETSLRWANHPRILLEVSLMKLCDETNTSSDGSLAEKIAMLERRIHEIGSRPAAPAPSGSPPQHQPGPGQQPANGQGAHKPGAAEPPVDIEAALAKAKPFAPWGDVIKELKNQGRMVLYTNLLNTRAIELGSKGVAIVFGAGSSFNKASVSKMENLEVLQATVSRLAGREIRVKCINQDEVRSTTAAIEEKDEFVEKAKDIATRLNVPLNIIDE